MSLNQELFWKKETSEEWFKLVPGLWMSEYMTNVIINISNLYKSTTIFPERENLFKAFKLCSCEELKVVILGAGPYEDSATGLAYANKDDVIRLDPVLEKIQNCIDKYESMDKKLVFDVTLESWAKQGVLLLNTPLTSEKYSSSTHISAWDKFVQTIIVAIGLYKTDIHFCFWGESDRYISLIDEKAHFIHQASHPYSAINNKTDWECNHFEEINKQLKTPITW